MCAGRILPMNRLRPAKTAFMLALFSMALVSRSGRCDDAPNPESAEAPLAELPKFGEPHVLDVIAERDIEIAIDHVASADPSLRAPAERLLMNLPGSALPTISKALEAGESPQATAVLERALPIIKARNRIVTRLL